MKSRPLSDLSLMASPPWTEDPRITQGRQADEALERHYESEEDRQATLTRLAEDIAAIAAAEAAWELDMEATLRELNRLTRELRELAA